MGVLVSSLFSLVPMPTILSFRVWESIVQYCHDNSQEPHTPLDLLLAYFPQDSLMSSSECIIMRFACLIELYAGFHDIEFQPYRPSLSHVQSCRAILYILCNLITFSPGGDFPLSVDILHMCPCIEHRHVPLLGTSLFAPMTLVSSQSVTIKQFYSFSRFLNICKSPKKSKNQKARQGKMLSFGSC